LQATTRRISQGRGKITKQGYELHLYVTANTTKMYWSQPGLETGSELSPSWSSTYTKKWGGV